MRSLALLLLLPAAALAQTVDTPRDDARKLALPDEEGAFSFVVFGDRTGGVPEGLATLEQAVRETNLLDPDLVMTVGDLVNGYNTTDEWLEQMRAYRKVMGGLRMRWYPVAGNHDIYWRGPDTPPGHHERNYEKHFGPLWYSFRHKNAAFVVLYSDEGDREKNRKGWKHAQVNRFSDAQLAWLGETLEKHRAADHVFVFLHHPRWIEEVYPDSNWSDVHALLRRAGNVRAVMAGHIHRRRYDGRRDGIDYLTLAVVGGHIPYEAKNTGWLNHFNVVTVRKNRVSHASIAVGATLDPKAMTPAHWEEVDALRHLRGEHEGVVRVAPEDATRGAYAIRYTNPTKRKVQLVLEGARGPWWFTPGHIHATLAPGESRDFRFRYARIPHGELRPPAFELSAEYLGPTQRVSLPVRRVPAEVELTGLDAGFWRGAGNHALRVGGRGSGVGVAASRLDVPDGPLTVEAWVRIEKHGRRAGLVTKTERSAFGLLLYDGVPNFHVHIGEKYATAKSTLGKLPVGTWVHVAGVYDGREVRVYVDGEPAGRRAGSGARTRNELPLYVGADPDRHGRPNSSLDGWVDEVRISKTARYDHRPFEPALRFEPDADTILLLHFDRALGSFHPDHSRSNAHGTERGRVGLEPRDGRE